MAQSTETQVNLKINRVPSKSVLDNMVANNQLQPNQLYMIESEQGEGLVALETKTLWTNPNPTSSFAAQSIITLDMSEYDYLIIDFNNGEANLKEWTNIIKKGSNTRISYTNGNSNKLGTRDLTYINSTSIQFADAYWSGSVLNSALIPYQIIGIKLINSQAEVTNIYSTDETVIGRWIDGKKIYRKVLTGTINNDVSKELIFDSNISNVSNYGIITINETMSFFIPSSGNTLYTPINFANPNNYIRANIQKGGDNNSIFVYVATPSNITGTIYATLEYTKTTE